MGWRTQPRLIRSKEKEEEITTGLDYRRKAARYYWEMDTLSMIARCRSCSLELTLNYREARASVNCTYEALVSRVTLIAIN